MASKADDIIYAFREKDVLIPAQELYFSTFTLHRV